jgi:hypothetical protein
VRKDRSLFALYVVTILLMVVFFVLLFNLTAQAWHAGASGDCAGWTVEQNENPNTFDYWTVDGGAQLSDTTTTFFVADTSTATVRTFVVEWWTNGPRGPKLEDSVTITAQRTANCATTTVPPTTVPPTTVPPTTVPPTTVPPTTVPPTTVPPTTVPPTTAPPTTAPPVTEPTLPFTGIDEEDSAPLFALAVLAVVLGAGALWVSKANEGKLEPERLEEKP